MKKHNLIALFILISMLISSIPAFAAENATLSGTITLDKPAEYDGYIFLSLSSTDQYSPGGSKEIPVKKGDTQVSYSVEAGKGVYSISYSENLPYPSSRKYTIYGDWRRNKTDEPAYIDLRWGSITNFDFTMSAKDIQPESTTNGGGDEDTVPITITMPSGIPKDKSVSIYFALPENITETSRAYSHGPVFKFAAGTTTDTKNASIEREDFIIAVEFGWSGFFASYFYSDEYGLTADKEKATVFSPTEKSIALDLSNAFNVISGTVSRNGTKPGEQLGFYVSAYVRDEQDDFEQNIYLGQSFYDENVYIAANEDSADYYILVPRGLNREAMLFIDYHMVNLKEDTPHENITLSGDVTRNLLFENKFRKITGTVTLTSPAPAGGLDFSVHQWENSFLILTIPQGKSSVEYTYYALNDDDELHFGTSDADARYSSDVTAEIDSQTLTCDAELIMYTKTVDGTVSVPQGETMPNAVSYKVTAIAYDKNDKAIDSVYQYGTIFTDGAAGKYSINLPDNTDRTEVSLEILAEGDMELTVIPGETDKDFVLTPEVGVSGISAEYDADEGMIAIAYTPDGKADYAAVAIAAVYDENHALAAVHAVDITFENDGTRMTFPVNIADELAAGGTLRLFVWKSLRGLTPVTDGEIPITVIE